MKERSTCECGGHAVITKVWDATYEIRCDKCGGNITYFTSPPEDAEANGYLIWLEVVNKYKIDE